MENPFEIIEERLLRIEELLLQIIEEKPVVRKVANVKDLMSVLHPRKPDLCSKVTQPVRFVLPLGTSSIFWNVVMLYRER